MILSKVSLLLVTALTLGASTLCAADPTLVTLPSAAGETKWQIKTPVESVIYVKPDGSLVVNNRTIPKDALSTSLEEIGRTSSNPVVILRCDQQADYGEVVRIIDLCKKANITNVAYSSRSSATPAPTPLALPTEPPLSTVPSGKNYTNNFRVQYAIEDQLALKKGNWADQIDRLIGRKKPIDLIFIGDSITEQWRWGAGNPVWNQYYEERAIDFGVGGDRTENVLWRLENLPIQEFHPKAIVILIGTNNWDAASTPETIAKGVKAVLTKTRQLFPQAPIVLVSILPNARANDKMAATNELIKTFADGKSVVWLDLASKFTPEGDNWKGLQKDKLHLSKEGYEMWAAELNPILRNFLP